MDSVPKHVIAALSALLALAAFAAVFSSQLNSQSNQSTGPISETQLYEHLTAVSELYTGESLYSGATYQAQTATQKLAQLWSAVTADTTSSTYSAVKTAAIFLEDLATTFTWGADDLPSGHVKSIHSVGNVAMAEWVSTGDHSFTGVFEGWKNVLIRLSCAAAPSATTIAPGMGVKFMRDGEASSNFVAMYSVDGQSSMDFFAETWVNHIGGAHSSGPAVLAKKFANKEGGTFGYVQQVGLKGCSAPGNVYPYSLDFIPTDEVKGTYDAVTKTYFTEQLLNVASGTTLFQVWAKAGPNSESKLIATLKTTSAMTTSKFGDETLFFQHAYELPDILSACDSGLPDCNDWSKATPRFTKSSFPFGSPPPPVPTTLSEIPTTDLLSGCPLMTRR